MEQLKRKLLAQQACMHAELNLIEMEVMQDQISHYTAPCSLWPPSFLPPTPTPLLLFLALTKQKHEQQGHWNKSFMSTIC